MINRTFYSILILILGISYALVMSLPFGIAFFYQKVFKKKSLPYFFILSGIFYILYFFIFSRNIFNVYGSMFFALGGILVAIASIRLYLLMTGGESNNNRI